MVRLNNNVYIVFGENKSCIYDLNNANLYRISNSFAKFLDEISEYSVIPEFVLNSAIYRKLCEEKIIVNEEDKLATLIETDAPKLVNGTIEITQKCNFRCIHCFEGDKLYQEMSFEDIKRVVDEFYEIGIKNIHIFGGEPFIHSNICDILYYCKDKFHEIAITTNASIYNDSRG